MREQPKLWDRQREKMRERERERERERPAGNSNPKARLGLLAKQRTEQIPEES